MQRTFPVTAGREVALSFFSNIGHIEHLPYPRSGASIRADGRSLYGYNPFFCVIAPMTCGKTKLLTGGEYLGKEAACGASCSIIEVSLSRVVCPRRSESDCYSGALTRGALYLYVASEDVQSFLQVEKAESVVLVPSFQDLIR